MAAMLHSFPYRAAAGGVHFRVEATLFTRPGLTADTTLGSWIFDDVDWLPIGVHLSPENVDVVRMASRATKDPQAYVTALRQDFRDQVPQLLAWLVGEALIGFFLGLLVAAAVNLALRYLRRADRHPHELRHRLRQLGVAVGVLIVVGAVGAATYNPGWAKTSRLTGTLGALQLFPQQLQEYYRRQATAFDVVRGIAAIQAQLQQNIDREKVPDTAFNIMFISDMHLASTYPLVREYVQNFGVSLVVNTGDESQFGTAAELTPAYRKEIESVTKLAPMLWVAGNHDSPTTAAVMQRIPGVYVLGGKTSSGEGYDVSLGALKAFGLRIGGIPDPRVYGAAGVYGSDDDSKTDKLERAAMDAATASLPSEERFDILMTHEPAAAAELAKDLAGRVRQVNSGHTHHQNSSGAIQSGPVIDLVEGSTGAGGLKEVGVADYNPSPIEFSIESVAANCQFTKVVRFQIAASTSARADLAAEAGNVTASTIYLEPQDVASDRVCSTTAGIESPGT
jgi:predicted MPP superfamily phosphohydrolase